MIKQITFSRLFGKIYATDAEAKAARDAAYREAKAQGKVARRSVLKGQLRQWAGMGIPDGRVCDCYELTIFE